MWIIIYAPCLLFSFISGAQTAPSWGSTGCTYCTASFCHQPQTCMAGAAQSSPTCCDGLAAHPSSLGFLLPSFLKLLVCTLLHWNQPLWGTDSGKPLLGEQRLWLSMKTQNIQNKKHRTTYLVTWTVAYQPLCGDRHRTRGGVWCPTKHCTTLGETPFLEKLTVDFTQTRRCLLMTSSKSLSYLFKLLHPWTLAACSLLASCWW